MEKAFKCDLCSETLNTRDNLNVHYHEHEQHDRILGRRKKVFKCNLCGNEFSRGEGLTRHMRTHTSERPFKCNVDDCGMAFKLELSLKIHVRRSHSSQRPFKCNFPGCHHTAKSSANLYTHKKVHSDKRPFVCSSGGCRFRAKHKGALTRHFNSAHSNAKPFACSKCAYKTERNDYFKVYVRRHTARRDLKCHHPLCTKSFKSSSDLKRHFSNRHEERNIKCDRSGCKRQFANLKALNDHKRFVHSKKTLACPNRECKYSTNYASRLARHVMVHEGSRNEKISCSVEGCKYKGKNAPAMCQHKHRHVTWLQCPVSGCGRYAPTKEALKHHAKRHNPFGRHFQCLLCFGYFQTLKNLQSHCAVHTNEKPFKCGHCEHAAARLGDIKSHISSAHAQVEFPIVVHHLNHVECIRCKITLPSAQFLVHSMTHAVPVVLIERLETR